MPLLPRQVAVSCIKCANQFLELADRPLPIRKLKSHLRRMAIVTAVTAIDAYIHGVVMRRLAHIRRRQDLPNALRRFKIPFSDLANLADAQIEAQRNEIRSRPWVRAKSSLQAKLLEETLQSYDQVSTALAMAGINNAWTEIGQQIGEQPQAIKERLNRIVHRRNQIAHEGDMMRASRPRRIRYNRIEPAQVRQDVAWIGTLLTAMEDVIRRQP